MKMASYSVDLKLLAIAGTLAVFTLILNVVDGLEPAEAPQFEAAFQGQCGRGSPCAQLCRELHDGTYECGCRPGHVLHRDGYSCQELNTTAKSISENYIDSEEDVLYQKDASFSAELDVAMVPAKESASTTTKSKEETFSLDDIITTTPSFKYFQTQAVNYNEDNTNNMEEEELEEVSNVSERSNKNFDSNTIPYYHEFPSKNIQKHGNQGTPLYIRNGKHAQDIEHDYVKNNEKEAHHYDNQNPATLSTLDVIKSNEVPTNENSVDSNFDVTVENQDLSSKKFEVTSKAENNEIENKKTKDDDEKTLITTTLGPSLEQKVPPMSTSGPGHTESAPRSGCPLGKMGANCDKAASQPTVPKFFGGSWIALPALRGAYKRVHLHMEFRPSSKNGILLLTGERSDMAGDYLVLLLHQGYVELIFDCGSGPGTIKSDTTVILNQWNSLTLYRRRWDAWLQLNGGKHVQGRSKGLFSRMTFLDPVFIGGRGNISGLEKLPVQSGYEGCIRSLNVNGRSYSWGSKPHGDAIDGFNIGECPIGGCGRGCLHGGRCLKRCLCPLGYAGDRCQTILDLQVPRFNGSSFLRYPGMGDNALSWLELQVTLKPTAKNGLIMYNAHRSDGVGDYFALYLKDNHVEFAFDLGTGQAIIRNSKDIKLSNWYTIGVSRTGRLAVLTVVSYDITSELDENAGMVSSQGLTPGAFTQLSLSQNLYLGGAPQFHIIQKRIGINESFSGCIQKVVINDHEQTIVSSALGGVNIDGCPHACSSKPCGSSICRPRLHHFTCICNPGDENEKCTIYLNETDTQPDYAMMRPHILGELEKIHFLHLKEFNSTIHSNIVGKKGPKPFISHHHKYRKTNYHKNKKHETLEHEVWDFENKRKALKAFNPKNKELEDQEWILNKNERDNEQLFHGELEHYVVDDFNLNEDFINVEKNNEQWTFKDKEETIEIPNFTGFDSYIRNNDPDILKRLSSHSVDINIRFKSVNSDGLLLWLGKDGMTPGDTFMALAVEEGLLTFRYDVGSGEVIIIANQTKVDDGLWHRARAARKGQSGVLDIDGLGAVGKVSPGRIRSLNTDTGLFIGGMSSIWPETLGRYNSGLTGCISMLTLDREFQIPVNLASNKYTISRNVGKCPP